MRNKHFPRGDWLNVKVKQDKISKSTLYYRSGWRCRRIHFTLSLHKFNNGVFHCLIVVSYDSLIFNWEFIRKQLSGLYTAMLSKHKWRSVWRMSKNVINLILVHRKKTIWEKKRSTNNLSYIFPNFSSVFVILRSFWYVMATRWNIFKFYKRIWKKLAKFSIHTLRKRKRMFLV